MTALQDFVAASFLRDAAAATDLGPGPYPGSTYYAAVQRYSALHTCNTWAAEALRHSGLPVRSRGVEFSWQLWRQVRRIEVQTPIAGNNSETAGAR